jgi:hypothetical protein
VIGLGATAGGDGSLRGGRERAEAVEVGAGVYSQGARRLQEAEDRYLAADAGLDDADVMASKDADAAKPHFPFCAWQVRPPSLDLNCCMGHKTTHCSDLLSLLSRRKVPHFSREEKRVMSCAEEDSQRCDVLMMMLSGWQFLTAPDVYTPLLLDPHAVYSPLLVSFCSNKRRIYRIRSPYLKTIKYFSYQARPSSPSSSPRLRWCRRARKNDSGVVHRITSLMLKLCSQNITCSSVD